MAISCPRLRSAHDDLKSILSLTHAPFDAIWNNKSLDGYQMLHPYSIWNYEYVPISDPIDLDLLSYECTNMNGNQGQAKGKEQNRQVDFERQYKLEILANAGQEVDAIIFWIDYYASNGSLLWSTKPGGPWYNKQQLLIVSDPIVRKSNHLVLKHLYRSTIRGNTIPELKFKLQVSTD
mmetsp:Transcript_3514/g.4729  ORF Transcript_3514/g.4729 Transcript_3514/m.4729 type:complete len:178 (+) Transcript_3514:444-977(+)